LTRGDSDLRLTHRKILNPALIAAIFLCLALQAWLALVMEINWDEFFYLSQIYSYQHGELGKPLQSFHIHLLGWLTSIPGNEIDQIVVGRFVMLMCEAGTCALIYLLARRFASRSAALTAVLAFTSACFTIIHGASFRADPLAALFIMGSLVVIARAPPKLGSLAGAAAMAAVAAMVTVKVVLYAPAFAGVALWRTAEASDRRRMIRWLAGAGAAAAIACALLYLVQLNLMPTTTNAGSRAGLANAAETQTGAGLLPRLAEIERFFLLSPLQVFLLAAGAAIAAMSLGRRARRPAEAIALLGCGATLLCLLFYRNAFPYFFPFILAPAVVLAAVAVDRIGLLSRHSRLVALGLFAPAVAVAGVWSTHGQGAQRELVSAVHRIFPSPVPYIDRNSMIASFPKRGFFMSTWGMSGYRARSPFFEKVLASSTVPLLVVDGPALEQTTRVRWDVPERLRLFPQDEAVLRDNYIPHWGRIWVAGKDVESGPGGPPFSIAVPGAYTLEAAAPVMIDGMAAAPGAVVHLSRGRHLIRSAAPVAVTLRWGDHLYRPRGAPSDGPVYRGF
jgi:hypothetical protein